MQLWIICLPLVPHHLFFPFLQPDGVIQIRIAVCGFTIYGIMTPLGSTWELIKDFSDNGKVFVLFCIGLIWTAATVTVPLTMSGRTRVDHVLSNHGTRFVLLGIALHMLFNISLMLPKNLWLVGVEDIKINPWSVAAIVLLLLFAVIGHGASWILVNTSFLVFSFFLQ